MWRVLGLAITVVAVAWMALDIAEHYIASASNESSGYSIMFWVTKSSDDCSKTESHCHHIAFTATDKCSISVYYDGTKMIKDFHPNNIESAIPIDERDPNKTSWIFNRALEEKEIKETRERTKIIPHSKDHSHGKKQTTQ